MSNIDTTKWITQAALAAELGVTVQCVHNWIKRKRIDKMSIPGSRLVLVDKTTAPAPKHKTK
jgi:DNA-binding transcriptional regulator YiaG